MRLYTVVYGVTYDRIRSYFVILLDARITTVSRRVVYDALRLYTAIVLRRFFCTRSYTIADFKPGIKHITLLGQLQEEG
jgi:hypothetical protein